MWITWMTTALAATPAEALGAALAEQAYGVAVACDPASAFYDVVWMSAQVMDATGAVVAPERFEALRRLIGQGAPVGGDAPLLLGTNQDLTSPLRVDLPVAGGPETLADLVGLGVLAVGPDGTLTLADHPATLVDGRLQVDARVEAPPTWSPDLLRDFGGERGCAVALDFVAGTAFRQTSFTHAALWLALADDGLFEIRVTAPSLPAEPVPLSPEPVAWRATSTLQPDMAGLVAVPLRTAIEAIQANPAASLDAGLVSLVRDLPAELGLPAGTQVAVFGEGAARRSVAVVPVLSGRGKPLKARKLSALAGQILADQGYAVQLQTDGALVALDEDRPEAWLRFSDGQLVYGDLPEVVAEVAEGTGERWGAPGAEALTDTYPFVLVPGRLPQVPSSVRVGLGVRFPASRIELGVAPLDGRDNSYLTGMLVGLLVPNLVALRNEAWRAALTRELSQVVTAQIGHHAVHGTFLGVPAAPRAVAELDAEAVPWSADESWAPLGFLPDDPFKGSYTVELNELGFIAHGFMDADGDGVPAHMVVTWTPEGPTRPVLLTPDEVY